MQLGPEHFQFLPYSQLLSLEGGYSDGIGGGTSRLVLDRRIEITVPIVEFANMRFKRH
jgi:hypothetical protein